MPVEHAFFAFNVPPTDICPESTSWALNFGAYIPKPPGSTGVQLRQVAFGRTPSDAGTLQPIFITDSATAASVSVPAMAIQPCCVAAGCDLAVYANGTWYEAPTCGAPPGCGSQSVQWYMASFENSAFGTCGGCGIVGDADLDITFSGAAMPLANFGSGTSFYVSYEPQVPTASSLVTTTPSISSSVSPSSTETPTASASESQSPSLSPSESVSPSVTKSATPTTSVGICTQAQQRFWGIRETVAGDVTYFITHGFNVTHPYPGPPELLVGHSPSCSIVGGACRCQFQLGSTASGCNGGRYVTIDYRISGANTVTVFNRQNPSCYYYFDANVGVASSTATPTVTPTVSPFERLVIAADSQTGFSGVQGANGWNYVYYNSNAPGSVAQFFTQFGVSPVMGGSVQYWYAGDTYCMIREINMHTNAATECTTPTGYCAPAVLWTNQVADATGRYLVTVNAAHSQYAPPSVDGVYVWLRFNGAVVAQYGPTAFAIQNQTFTVWNLTTAELILDPVAGCNLDRTTYQLTVQRYELLPSATGTSSVSVSVSASPSPSDSVTVSVSASMSVSVSWSPSVTASESGSSSESVTASISASVSASTSVSASPSVSDSVSVSPSPSASRSRSVSRSVTRSRTGTSSVSLTGTPEFQMSRWPSSTATGSANVTRTPAFAVTPWPSRGFTRTGTATPQYMLLPIPSASGSAVAAASESEEAVKSRTVATAVGGAAVGAVGAGVVAMIVQNLRPPQVPKQQTQQQQRPDEDRRQDETEEDEERRRRRRRRSSDEEEEEEEDNSGNRLRSSEDEEDDVDLSGNPVAPQPSRQRMRSNSEEIGHTVIFAFRPEDITEIRSLLVRHGVTYTENPHLL